jgi:hypothetical protein
VRVPSWKIVVDTNGCNDITSVTVTVKDPSDNAVVSSQAASFASCAVLTTATYTYTVRDMAGMEGSGEKKSRSTPFGMTTMRSRRKPRRTRSAAVLSETACTGTSR